MGQGFYGSFMDVFPGAVQQGVQINQRGQDYKMAMTQFQQGKEMKERELALKEAEDVRRQNIYEQNVIEANRERDIATRKANLSENFLNVSEKIRGLEVKGGGEQTVGKISGGKAKTISNKQAISNLKLVKRQYEDELKMLIDPKSVLPMSESERIAMNKDIAYTDYLKSGTKQRTDPQPKPTTPAELRAQVKFAWAEIDKKMDRFLAQNNKNLDDYSREELYQLYSNIVNEDYPKLADQLLAPQIDAMPKKSSIFERIFGNADLSQHGLNMPNLTPASSTAAPQTVPQNDKVKAIEDEFRLP